MNALAHLAAREARIPALADPEVTSLQCGYLRYKPGTSIVATLGESLWLYAVSPAAAPKASKLAELAPSGSVVRYDPAALLLVARPAADRDLPALRREVFRAERADAVCTLVHKPQRRWVGRIGNGPVLRAYRPEDDRRNRWPLGGPVRVPAILSSRPRSGLVAIEHLPGTTLDAVRDSDLRRAALRRAGAGLARWHALPPPTQPADVPDIHEVAGQLRALVPEQAERVGHLVGALDRHIGQDGVWCHGDFSADQILLCDDGEIAFLDWDRSGAGAPALDLAGADAAGLDADERDALYSGYAEHADLPADLTVARARARFCRAADPFRRADPDWPAGIATRLDQVEELLA